MKTIMKLAIHHREGSFSERWIEYCEKHNISYVIVNSYQSDIIKQLQGCDGIMWHWHHGDPKGALFARQLIYSVEAAGKKVFPNSKTCWHFDDKVGQKYLLESVGVPVVPSHVFYDEKSAQHWIEQATFPKVFKLRCGAGSSNVRLVRDKTEARALTKKAFSRGFSKLGRASIFKDRLFALKRDQSISTLWRFFRGFMLLLLPTKFDSIGGREKGYVYFQDYIPNNEFDIRVIVIGDRAFAIKRLVREGDFRASGSGKIVYDQNQIPLECVKIAFDSSLKLGSQCLGYDFIFDGNRYYIVEISYAFTAEGYDPCPGYWDRDLKWNPGRFIAQEFMVEDFIRSLIKTIK